MADIELIIKIPENYDLSKIQNGSIESKMILNAVANGIPLPKGHGKLFILDETKAREYFTNFNFSLQNWISEVDISKATLKVIEADEEAEE